MTTRIAHRRRGGTLKAMIVEARQNGHCFVAAGKESRQATARGLRAAARREGLKVEIRLRYFGGERGYRVKVI